MERTKQIILGIAIVAGFIGALVLEKHGPDWLCVLVAIVMAIFMICFFYNDLKKSLLDFDETEYIKRINEKIKED